MEIEGKLATIVATNVEPETSRSPDSVKKDTNQRILLSQLFFFNNQLYSS